MPHKPTVMEVKVLAINRVICNSDKLQAAMFVTAFGDVITSQVFRVTSKRLAKELNKANASGNMPEVIAFKSTDSPRMLFQLKFKS